MEGKAIYCMISNTLPNFTDSELLEDMFCTSTKKITIGDEKKSRKSGRSP